MLVNLRGGCGDKGGRVLLVGENMLLCKARSTMILNMEILHRKMAIMV
jgi:hypothetical protein